MSTKLLYVQKRIIKAVKEIFVNKKIVFFHDYERYWKLRGKHSIMPRFKVFKDFIMEGSKVLDVGCGDGIFGEYLLAQKSCDYLGIDISKEALRLASERRLKTMRLDVTDIKKLKKTLHTLEFDYVIMSEIIEHIQNPEEVISFLKTKTRYFIISLPNTGFITYRLRLLFGRFPVQWVFFPSEHIRFWTLIDFDVLINFLKLKKEKLVPVTGVRYLKEFAPNLFADQVVYLVLVKVPKK